MVYVHVDVDVLAPEYDRGHNLAAPNGPAGLELAAFIELLFTYPKTTVIGIASNPMVHAIPDTSPDRRPFG